MIGITARASLPCGLELRLSWALQLPGVTVACHAFRPCTVATAPIPCRQSELVRIAHNKNMRPFFERTGRRKVANSR